MASKQRFRTSPTYSDETIRVDHDKRIIYGYAVASKGVVKDGRAEFDDETIDAIVRLGQAKSHGAKSRFTHPSMSDDGTGKFLAESHNFRRDGDVARADLHISPMANKSPDAKGAGDYVLGMADHHPDHFGSSVVISMTEKFRINEDGTKKTDENGDRLPPLARVQKLWAVDIVGEPNANEALFSMDEPSGWASKATELLGDAFGNLDADEQYSRGVAFLERAIQHQHGGWSPPTPQPINEGVTMSTITTTPVETTPVETTAGAAPAETSAQAAAPAAPRVDVAAVEKAAIEKHENRREEIFALCETAGVRDKAAEFFAAGLTAEEVKEKTWDMMSKERQLTGSDLPANVEGKSGNRAKREQEFAQFADLHDDLDITKEMYCTDADPLNGGKWSVVPKPEGVAKPVPAAA